MRRQLECNYGFLWCFSAWMMMMFLQMQLVSWGTEPVSSSQGSPLGGAVAWGLLLHPAAVVCWCLKSRMYLNVFP